MARQPQTLKAELRWLKEGRGLTPDRVGHCPLLLTAFGTKDQQQAWDRLVTSIDSLGADRERVRALKCAYALEKPPEWNRDWELQDRRADFGRRCGRKAGAIRMWEDSVVDEIARLLEEKSQFIRTINVFYQSGRLDRVGVADHNIAIYSRQLDEGDIPFDEDIDQYSITRNTSSSDSLPMFIYRMPPLEARPRKLLFLLHFRQLFPTAIVAVTSVDLVELLTLQGDHAIDDPGVAPAIPAPFDNDNSGIVRQAVFEDPLPGAYFAMAWTWPLQET